MTVTGKRDSELPGEQPPPQRHPHRLYLHRYLLRVRCPRYLGLDIQIETQAGSGGTKLYNPSDPTNDVQISVTSASPAVTYTVPTTGTTCPVGAPMGSTCYAAFDELVGTVTSSSPAVNFSISVTIPTSSPNGYQAGTAQIILTTHAVQSANNGTTGVCTAGSECDTTSPGAGSANWRLTLRPPRRAARAFNPQKRRTLIGTAIGITLAVAVALPGIAEAMFANGPSPETASLTAATIGAPTNFTASMIGGSATLSWTAPVPAYLTGYTLSQSSGTLTGCSATPSASTTSCTATGLTPGAQYTWSLTAAYNNWQSLAAQASPPTVTVTYPVNSTTYGANWSGTITGSAATNSGTSIASAAAAIEDTTTGMWWTGTGFSASSQTFVSASGTTSWSYALPAADLTSGHSYTVTGEAADMAGNVGTSAALKFHLQHQPASERVGQLPGHMAQLVWGQLERLHRRDGVV